MATTSTDHDGTGENYVDEMPWDCVCLIFSYLDWRSLGRLALVSKRWRHLSSQDCLVRVPSIARHRILADQPCAFVCVCVCVLCCKWREQYQRTWLGSIDNLSSTEFKSTYPWRDAFVWRCFTWERAGMASVLSLLPGPSCVTSFAVNHCCFAVAFQGNDVVRHAIQELVIMAARV